MIEPKPTIARVTRVQEDEPSRLYKTRLDRSERTHPFSDAFVERVRRRLDGEWIMTYPEPGPLYERFAAFLGQPRERLLFASGSDQSIKAVYETYISPGDKVLMHRPGYAMYPVYATMFGAEAVYADFDSELAFDWDGYVGAVDGSLRMAVLENPNGFVGVAPPADALERFVAKCEAEGVIALIDEAYFHFHDVTAADLIGGHENLVVVRTLSKAFGVAGLRAGYTLSRPANIANLSKVKPMHELNAVAILVVDELLAQPDEFASFVAETRECLAFVLDGLRELGVPASDSVANFFAARLGGRLDTDAFRERLRGEGILVRRPFREAHLAEWVRIGTGPKDAMQRVLDVAAELLSAAKRGRVAAKPGQAGTGPDEGA